MADAAPIGSIRENRIEAWLRRRPANHFVLMAGFAALLFLFDSVIAFALVLSGAREADQFYTTAWMSQRVANHADLRGLSLVLPRGPHLYGDYMDRFEADGLLGGRLVRSFLTIAPWKVGWADKTFWFMTNDQGFPPVDETMTHYAVPKPAGVFRVVVIGGSTVEGVGLNSPFDSLPAKLQADFNAALRSHPNAHVERIEVINAGVSNYASDSEYLFLLADLLPFQPDLLIAYDGWNDAEVLPTWIAGDRSTRLYRSGPQQANGARVNASFTVGGASTIAAAVASQNISRALDGFATFRLLHGLFNRSMPAPAVQLSYRPSYSHEAARFYIENRERMLFLAQQNHFRFASVLQPLMYVDGKTYSEPERDNLSRISPTQKQEREGFYATVRPLLQQFRAIHQSGDNCVADISEITFDKYEETVYVDSGHLLPAGNQIVADKILGELRRCAILPF